jgi:hypothetical protein
LEVAIDCCILSRITARKKNLPEHQRKLTYRVDSINRWLVQKQTCTTVEHKIEETSEKSGETTSEGKTLKLVAIYTSLSQTFLEVCAKVR